MESFSTSAYLPPSRSQCVPDRCVAVDTLVQQVTSITTEMLKRPDYEDSIENHAPRFALFFSQLRLLLSDNVDSMYDKTVSTSGTSLPVDPGNLPLQNTLSTTETSTVDSKKRPNSLTIITSSPLKQRLISSNTPHTPNQPTIPKNPDFSGDSIESTDEDNTKRMIGTLIDTTLLCLRSDFTHIRWPKYVRNCRIRSSGYLYLV